MPHIKEGVAPRWQEELRSQVRTLRTRVTNGRREAALGVGIVAFGVVLARVLRPVDFWLLDAILTTIWLEDSGRLLLVGAQMTALNTLRVLPIYLGAFILMEACIPEEAELRQRLLGYLVPGVLVPGSYIVIGLLFKTRYDFGVPATLSLLGAIGMHALSRFRQGTFVKTAVLSMFIFGWQWLGLAPRLTGYGFGNGDLSIGLKTAAEFLGQEQLLDQWSFLTCGLFIGVAFVMAKFMVDHTNHVELLRRHQAKENELQRVALQHLGARSQSEMQALVHDLKTPLMTVQGLVSVLGMTSTDKKQQEHIRRVEQSVERMNHMISEILYPETRQVVDGLKLVRFLQAHVSGGGPSVPQVAPIRFEIGADLPAVEVNVVRFTRALANLIQNAQEAAVQSPKGRSFGVVVKVRAIGGKLRVRIIDRGVGIERSRMEHVFEPGFSTKESSGLGLSFARDVIVGEHGGDLQVYSVPDKGTCIVAVLEGVAS